MKVGHYCNFFCPQIAVCDFHGETMCKFQGQLLLKLKGYDIVNGGKDDGIILVVRIMN